LLQSAHGPIMLSYVDTRKVFELVYPIVPMIAQVAFGQLSREGIDLDVSILPSAGAIGKHLRPQVAVLRRSEAGIEFVSRQTLPGGNIGSTAPVAVALLLPAVHSARGAARRVQSMNNLKQIGLAMLMHEAASGAFAAYIADKQGKPLLSWRVKILPFIEEQALYEQFRLDEPWDSEHNKKLIARMPPVYMAPGSNAGPGKTNYVTVRGEKTAFPGKKGISIAQIRDGTAYTIMAVEASDQKAVIWTKPDDFEYDQKNPVAGLTGLRRGGFNAAFCDGHVRFISQAIDADTLKALFTRDGREPVDHSKF
jgi:prepilin-type processing-associated H-X9-DG protein